MSSSYPTLSLAGRYGGGLWPLLPLDDHSLRVGFKNPSNAFKNWEIPFKKQDFPF
jgi:hypothetical protein